MATLESFVSGSVVLTRDRVNKEITITGAVLTIDGTLDSPLLRDRFTPSAVASASNALTFSAAQYAALSEGSSVILSAAGGYPGLSENVVYYVVKPYETGSSIQLATSYANAIASTPIVATFTGPGIASNVRVHPQSDGIPSGYRIVCKDSGGLQFDAAAIVTIGDEIGKPVVIVEESTAFRFGSDNYATTVCRFNAGATIRLNRVFWKVATNGSGTRSDFDVARGTDGAGGKVTFKDCQIETDTQFNHLAGKLIVIDGLIWRNNRAASLGANQFEMSDPLDVAPSGLFIDSDSGSYILFLTANFTDDVPVAVENYSGANVGLHEGSGNTIVQLNDPGASVGKNGNSGVLRIHRRQTVAIDGAVAAGTLYFDAADTGGTDATKTLAAATTSETALLRTKFANHDTSSFTDCAGYSITAVGYGFQKNAVAEFDVATTPVAKTLSLVSDLFPNDDVPAASTATVAANLDDVYSFIKKYEIDNRTAFGISTPIATVSSEGYLDLSTNSVIRFLATQATKVAIDTVTINGTSRNRVSVKCAATLTVGSKGFIGIRASGTDGTIQTTGVDIAGIISLDSAGASSTVTVTVQETGSQIALFSSAGIQTGSVFTSTDASRTVVIKQTAAQSLSGQKLIAYKYGFEPQIRTLDTSAGGAFSVAFNPLREITQSDGSSTYLFSSITDLSSVTFTITDLAAVDSRLNVADGAIDAQECFSRFAYECGTVTGLKYLAFGGNLVQSILLFSGNVVVLPSSCKIKRAAAGNNNASVLAVVFRDGDAPVDLANGSVHFIGGVQISHIQNAIITDFDIDLVQPGIQSLAGAILYIQDAARSLSDQIGVNSLVTNITPSGFSNNAFSGDGQEMQTGDIVRFSNLGGYGGLNLDQSYYVRLFGATFKLYTTRLEALNNTAVLTISGSGVIGNVRYSFQRTLASNVQDCIQTIATNSVELGIKPTLLEIIGGIKTTDFPAVSNQANRLGSLLNAISPNDIRDAVLAAVVESGGDTVQEALARVADIEVDSPTTAEIVTAIKGADFPAVSDEASRLGSLLAAIKTAADTDTAAAPLASAIRDAIMATVVESGGDTVQESLARVDGLAARAVAPTVAEIITAIKGADFPAVSDEANRLGSQLAAIKLAADTDSAAGASAADVRDAVLAAPVETNGDTVKQALARLDDLPASVLAATVDGNSLTVCVRSILAVLAGATSFDDGTNTITFKAIADGTPDQVQVVLNEEEAGIRDSSEIL